MIKNSMNTLLRALIIAAFSAVVALGTNALRGDGIPIVAEAPYDIFAECKDSTVTAAATDNASIAQETAEKIYVDARPREEYLEEHIKAAINIPYSALFGASKADIDQVRRAKTAHPEATIIVYGLYAPDGESIEPVDFGRPLADQLAEAGIGGVTHIIGGIATLKNAGVRTVKGE